MLRAALVVAALLGPLPAGAACLLACDEATAGPEAASRLAALLGRPLPSGATVAGLVEGGFQDAFLQARIEAADAGTRDAVLAALSVAGDLRGRTDESFGPTDGPAWFDAEAREGLQVGEGAVAGYAYALAGVAPGAAGGGWTIYLWAFQT